MTESNGDYGFMDGMDDLLPRFRSEDNLRGDKRKLGCLERTLLGVSFITLLGLGVSDYVKESNGVVQNVYSGEYK